MQSEPPDALVIRAKQAHDDVAANPDRFRPAAEAIVAEARRARHPEALALALRALAWADRARLDDRSAVRLLNEGCRVARRHHLGETLADLLMSHASVSLELGRTATAFRDLAAAAELIPAAQRWELEFTQAVLLQNTGELAEAETMYHRVLANPATSERRRIGAANNLALIESEQGKHAQALRRLDGALRGARESSPALVAAIIGSTAQVTVQSGRFTAALALFDQAEREYQAAGLPLGEHYLDYAEVLMQLRLLPEAVAAARRAVAEFSAAGVPLMAAEAQLRLAQLALLTGDLPGAMGSSAAAGAAFRRQARTTWRARTLLVIAEARLRSGGATASDLSQAAAAARRLAGAGVTSGAVQGFLVTGKLAMSLGRRRQAIAALARAHTLARGASVLVRLRGRVSGALAASLQNRDSDALAHCRRGLADLARHRGSLPSVELRALASGHGEELGHIGLDIVTSGGSPARVLNWMERGRAAALLAVEPPEFDGIKDDLTAWRAAHDSESDPSVPAGPQGRGRGVTVEQAVIEDRIRRATWQAGATVGSAAGPVGVGALRGLLAGRTLVTYGMLRGDLVAVVIGPRGSRLARLGPAGPVHEELRAFLFALRRLAEPRTPGQLTAARDSADLRIRRLAETLIAPLQVTDDTELVIIGVPDMQGVPWSALHRGPVCLAPSATFWARSATAAAVTAAAVTATGAPAAASPAAAASVALIAGPDLPGALAEVESIAAIYPSVTPLMPPDSTADRVTDALAGAKLAHLACHGVLRADNPMFSSLLLSDGPLTVHELYARGLAPHRLILASCESGTHVSYAGDEVLGFVGALLARGTAGVLASTAAVPDVEAAGFMTAVHHQLARGDTLAHALHAARATLDISDPRAFINWCTFSAHGAA
jgi:tetratricopeptide (TPR) repeat protein